MTLELRKAELCPLCQKNNNCYMANTLSSEVCWCFEADFPKEIFEQLPSDREKICICKNCLSEFIR